MRRRRKCGLPCEVYSRVVGYYRPVDNWNVGKQAEFAERKTFAVGDNAATSSEGSPGYVGAEELLTTEDAEDAEELTADEHRQKNIQR